MKSSIYTVFIQTKDKDSFIAYNTLRGSIVLIDSQLKSLLEENTLPQEEEALKKLEETGLIVEDAIDEKQVYKYQHHRHKHNNSYVHFCIVVTYDCNFRCPYCYQGAQKEKKPISDEVIEKLLKCIKRACTERKAKDLEITLYGGEPFLYPDKCKRIVEEAAAWAKEQGVQFHLSALTNGSLLTPELIDWLSSYSARVQIPLDGAKEVHDRYRFDVNEKKGSYEKLMKVFAAIKNTNITLHLRISVTKETYPTMKEMLFDLKERGLLHLHPDFCYITSFVDACTQFSKQCLRDSELYKVLPELWETSRKLGFKTDLLRPQVSPLPCSSIADGSFVVDPDGDLYKCWELVIQKEHVVGTILADGRIQLKKPFYATLARDPSTIEWCRDCELLPACSGGCICKACWNYGTYDAKGCGSIKFLLKKQLTAYLLQEYPEKFEKLLVGDKK